MTKLFVYGTLMSDYVVSSLLKKGDYTITDEDAILKDYTKIGLNIHSNSGQEVLGRVIEVNETAKERLDRYESLGSMYKEIEVTPVGYKTSITAYQIIGTDED